MSPKKGMMFDDHIFKTNINTEHGSHIWIFFLEINGDSFLPILRIVDVSFGTPKPYPQIGAFGGVLFFPENVNDVLNALERSACRQVRTPTGDISTYHIL